MVSGTNLFAGTIGGGVFLSTDNGTNWTAYNSSLGYTSITSLVVSGENLFAGTGVGVFLFTDNGTIRTEVNSGLLYRSVHSLVISEANIFVGTGSGVWRRPLSEMITDVKMPSEVLPTYFRLQQNYPNPFNPSTLISYELPTITRVTLKLYDMLGREVRTLVNERQNVGSHSVILNASGLSSGIYFYRLQAGHYVETKKLLLLK